MLDEAVNSNASREERTQMFYDLQDAVKASGKILPLYEKTVNFAEKPGFDVSDSIRADGYLVANYLK